MFYATVYVDRQHAQLLRFNAHHVHGDRVDVQHHVMRRHGNGDDATRLFYEEVCRALRGTREILLTGAPAVLDELRQYLQTQRHDLAPRIADYQPGGPVSLGTQLATARNFFAAFERPPVTHNGH